MNHDSTFTTREGFAVRTSGGTYLRIVNIHQYTIFSVKAVPMPEATLFPRPDCLGAGQAYYVAEHLKMHGHTGIEWVRIAITETKSATVLENGSGVEPSTLLELQYGRTNARRILNEKAQ